MPQQPLRFDSGILYDDPQVTWDGFVPAATTTNKTMPSDNRISAAIAAADKTTFLGMINDATSLIPFAVNLTPDERRRLVSIGLGRSGMLDVFSQEMTSNPTLVPPFIDMVEVNKDLTLYRDLMVLEQAVAVLREKLDDTMKLTSVDLFTAFSGFYASVKEARRRNVPGADAVYDRLSPFFARSANRPASNTPSAPTS